MAPAVPPQFQPTSPGQVTFQVRVRDLQQDDFLCLVGEPEELGAWKEPKSRIMSPAGPLRWSVQLEVVSGRIIKYKYLRVSKDKDGQWVQWEDGQNREFCWNGASVAQDDGEIHGFGARLQLPKTTNVTTLANCRGDNSVKAHVGWISQEEVPKHQWTCDMFNQMGLALQDVEDKMGRFEKNISDFSRRMEESEISLKHHRRILLTLENKLDDVEEKLGNGNFLQLIEQGLQDSKFSQKHQELEHDVACLQQKMRNFSALIASNDLRFQKFQDAMDLHAKSLAGLHGQLSHPKDCRPSAQIGSKLKELESQLTAVTALTAMSQVGQVQKSPGDRTSEPSPPVSGPGKLTSEAAHIDIIDSLQSGPSKLKDSNDERFAAKASEIPRRRSISMPKSRVSVRARSPFVGFQIPQKPQDEAMKKLCLEVEEELHQAVSHDFSAEAREKLLKRLWVKVHPDKLLDKTGKRREAFNWFEDWKGIHIIWYYRPHPVPEADRKYLPKDSHWRLD